MSLSIRDRSADIINLNVGGTRFSTSRNTLTWVPDSFFSSMLSGRISTQKDGSGAIFIDRDPDLFRKILNFLRTKDLDIRNCDQRSLLHEAEFYGLTPLVRKLKLCEDLESPACGDILFHGHISPPTLPYPLTGLEDRRNSNASVDEQVAEDIRQMTPIERHFYFQRARKSKRGLRHLSSLNVSEAGSTASLHGNPRQDFFQDPESRRQSPAANATIGNSPCRVTMLKGHFNWLVVSYPHFVCLYRQKDQAGWSLLWTSAHIEQHVDRVTLNVKMPSQSQDTHTRMVAASYGTNIRLWGVTDDGKSKEIGVFDLTASLQHLFFIGSQLVALSPLGKIGVWHAMTQNWQVQDVVPICSFDTAGSFLLLGCENGSIYYIDMQKFPLRMKDNDLLVTELYRDPSEEMVTALSVYLTPRTSLSGNWIEIAYGTHTGKVRVIVQHPETVGQGPQLFQTFTVHASLITKVMLSEKHLISVCSEYNHVRAWSVTRFRGMISTQPGSMPLASFKVVSLEHVQLNCQYMLGNDIGPYGDKDDQQVFIQKVVPETDTLFVRLAWSGKRICKIQSVDETEITSFCVHECEGSSRMGSRPRRYLFTGHSDGSIQIWDLSTAIEVADKTNKGSDTEGPSAQELLDQLDFCDLTNSCTNTPSISPSTSLLSTIYPGRATTTPEKSHKETGAIPKSIPKKS